MKKVIILTAILCTAICIGLHTQSGKIEKPISTLKPLQIEVITPPTPVPEIEIIVPEIEELVIEIIESPQN